MSLLERADKNIHCVSQICAPQNHAQLYFALVKKTNQNQTPSNMSYIKYPLMLASMKNKLKRKKLSKQEEMLSRTGY